MRRLTSGVETQPGEKRPTWTPATLGRATNCGEAPSMDPGRTRGRPPRRRSLPAANRTFSPTCAGPGYERRTPASGANPGNALWVNLKPWSRHEIRSPVQRGRGPFLLSRQALEHGHRDFRNHETKANIWCSTRHGPRPRWAGLQLRLVSDWQEFFSPGQRPRGPSHRATKRLGVSTESSTSAIPFIPSTTTPPA